MQEPAAGAEQRLGVDAAAVGRVAVERRWRHRRAPGPLVAHQDPEPSGPGFAQARGEHRHGGAVGVQRGAGPNVTADRLGQGRKQKHCLPDPVGQRRAVEVHALTPSPKREAFAAEITAWRCCGRGSQYLDTSTWAIRPGPNRPRSIGSAGIGCCTTVSRARQLSFGRTWRITLKLLGTYSSTSRSSCPTWLNTVPPQLSEIAMRFARGTCRAARG